MASSRYAYPHIAWGIGHGVVLLGTIYTLLSIVLLPGGNRSYSLSYAGAIVSWGIVVYKTLGKPQANRVYLEKALMDENVQYLILAVYWFLQKPIYVTLIPFATFSLFHTLTFIRTTVLPKAPASPAVTPGVARPAAPPTTPSAMISKQIQVWVKANYEKAMVLVSFVEVVLVFGRVLFGAILFQNSFLAPLLFAHFLRLRYYLSTPTRQAFAWVDGQIDHATSLQQCPASVKQGVNFVRSMIIRYSESVIPIQGQQAAAGAVPPAAAAPAAGARR